jgi:hypothetical protein
MMSSFTAVFLIMAGVIGAVILIDSIIFKGNDFDD